MVLPQGQPEHEGAHHQTASLGGIAHLLAEYFKIERSSVSHEQNRSNRNALSLFYRLGKSGGRAGGVLSSLAGLGLFLVPDTQR